MKQLAALIFLFTTMALAQVAPPKHSLRDVENLEQRYKEVECSIVLILRGDKFGTGFYINADGDVATASHVLGERVWTSKKEDGVTVDLVMPAFITVVSSANVVTSVPKEQVELNREAWGADVAVIKTGKKTNCWLAIGDDSLVRPGQHVITLGFPGLAHGSLSLYSGIVSATKVRTNIPMGKTTTGQNVVPENEFLRVQMPISGGLSGAPVLDDNNRAIAVVTLAGVWTQELDLLMTLADKKQLGELVPVPNTLNLGVLVAELAESFHQYASPGYGDSVPLSYLEKKASQSGQPSSLSAH